MLHTERDLIAPSQRVANTARPIIRVSIIRVLRSSASTHGVNARTCANDNKATACKQQRAIGRKKQTSNFTRYCVISRSPRRCHSRGETEVTKTTALLVIVALFLETRSFG